MEITPNIAHKIYLFDYSSNILEDDFSGRLWDYYSSTEVIFLSAKTFKVFHGKLQSNDFREMEN